MKPDPNAPPAHFFDEDMVLRASISDTNLTIYAGENPPISYPLDAIVDVRRMNLPGGQTAVGIWLADRPQSPGLTFRDRRVAEAFFTRILGELEPRT